MRDPVCIIPARGGSKRLPRKNIREVHGKPLLGHAVDSAKASGVFSEVIVSSDDSAILEVGREHGATVEERPGHLATDRATVVDVCEHLVNELETRGWSVPSFGVLLTTNPLRTADQVREAWDLFVAEGANYVVSLVPYDDPPQNALWAPEGYVEPYWGPEEGDQSQLLETLYTHDGGVVFCRTEAFLEERTFFGSECVPYYIERDKSVDIDRPIDLEWAEFLMERRDARTKDER